MNYVTPKEACEFYKVTPQTLREWAKRGKIQFIISKGGHRRYNITDTKKTGTRSIIYSRVSSRKQEADLKRQSDYLRYKYPTHEVVEDIGSGINNKRAGFRWILDSLLKRDIKEVVVVSYDRFVRIGADHFIWLFEQFNSKLISMQHSKYRTPSEELADDLMEIITVFSARYYGRRNRKNKENKDLSNYRAT